ncbi:U8 snoRNA-decapping enzyme-like [Montipora foliosa]|uniref:U8 snoRNA-decapping enzyme-like n=1 Tax=Montipora foliosa TaxID=591990 RepID=UPI0035F10B30
MAHFTANVIPRASALALQGYKHCCHVMLHCPTDAKLFGYYPVKHVVLMQLRFDGRFGFPGGFVDGNEDLETAINREVVEELGQTTEPLNINKDDYVISHKYEEYVPQLDVTKKLCLHFFAKRVPLDQFLELEMKKPEPFNLDYEVLGVVRCPLYVMRDKQGGLPSFLQNNFVGNSRQQFLIGLEHASILSQEEIREALRLSQLIQVSLPKL